MPSAPPVIFLPQTPGSPASSPKAVFAPAPTGLAALLISGVTTAGINGTVIYCGLIAEKPAWSTDGTQVAGASNTIVEYAGGTQWKVSRGSSYAAVKTSAAASPVGLTSWTVSPGTGSPTVAAGSPSAPPAVFVPG